LEKLRSIFTKFLTEGHSRTLLAKKNIIASFGIKGLSILIQFSLVPLTLNYLGTEKYGIWMTLSSVIAWFSLLDIGLGNGLRNKLSEALAENNLELSKTYISTTYAALIIIMVTVYVMFLLINPLLSWDIILNTDKEAAKELSLISLIIFSFFAMRFVLKLIGTIFKANQLPFLNEMLQLIGNFLILVAIFVISKYSSGSLVYLSIAFSAVPVLILLLATIYFFNNKYKAYKPSYKNIDFKFFKPLAGLGMKFFVIQLAALVIFSTDNLIITQLLGPEFVTPYNISFKYFSIPIVLFAIIIGPFWSAFTEALKIKDISWITISLKKLILIWLFLIVLIIGMVLVSDRCYKLWIGDSIIIPTTLTIIMGLYVIIMSWNTIYANFLNGAGKISLQIYYSLIGMVINIPLSILFSRNLDMGVSGVVLASCLSLSGGFIFGPIQTLKILSGKAKGVWNK
jgi:O-antigen/teichoic acid export membrane protein